MASLTAIDRVAIVKIVSRLNNQATQLPSGKVRQLLAQISHHALRAIAIYTFVVMPCKIIATIRPPMLPNDITKRLISYCHYVEPEQNRPQTVFFAHMIRAGAKTLLTTKRNLSCIKQVTKKLPASRRFKKVNI